MQFVTSSEAPVLAAGAALANGNPFLPERIEHERRCLGEAFIPSAPVWHADAELPRPNVPLLRERLEGLLRTLRGRLADGAKATREELVAFEGLVRHVLYMRYEDVWSELIRASERGEKITGKVPAYRAFARDVEHLCEIPGGVSLPVRSHGRRAGSHRLARDLRWPPRSRPGSANTSARTTCGRATCASSSSACET